MGSKTPAGGVPEFIYHPDATVPMRVEDRSQSAPRVISFEGLALVVAIVSGVLAILAGGVGATWVLSEKLGALQSQVERLDERVESLRAR